MSPAPNRAAASLELGGAPHAMLLPPEVIAAARAKRTRRNLLAIIILAAAVVVAAYLGMSLVATGAQVSLQEAQQQTATLLQEQTKYSPVQTAQGKVAAIQGAQQALTVHEVDWRAYLKKVQSTLPSKATITSTALTADNPVNPSASSVALLTPQSIAKLTLTITTGSTGDVPAWIGRLAKLPGYAGATPTSVQKQDKGYLVTLDMLVDDSAVDHRFDAEAAQ